MFTDSSDTYMKWGNFAGSRTIAISDAPTKIYGSLTEKDGSVVGDEIPVTLVSPELDWETTGITS
jgi:hypothetical protein